MVDVTGNTSKTSLDLGSFVGDLNVDDETASDDISLEGLEEELQECQADDVVANILSKGTTLREYTKGVENNLRQVELDSIQDYIKESDNLVSLHDQIRDCDMILSQMETLLSGFQAEIGSISSDIKILQEKSMDMGVRLKNRKVAESKLAKFVEDIIVPPRMIDTIVDEEVNEEYMRTLEILSKKLKCADADPTVKTSKALKDVQPELEKLRQKAVSKVFDFMVQKLYALRKPKTNIQILQQSVLLKYKYILSFLKEHGKEVYLEVRAAYIDTMNKVLSAQFRAYIQALEKLQLDIATSNDLIGVETRSTGLFSRGREPLKNRSAVFALGERINILKEIEEPPLIPHIAEASSKKYPYEVLFRSLHKLLMDTASSEYLFCDDFFGEQTMFHDIFAGPFSVIDEHFSTILPNSFDAIGLMLMIRIIHQHQLVMSRRRIPCLDSYLDKVNIALWPRFKMVFDLHLHSLRNANIRTLWEDDVHPHYVIRRYAEFSASLIHLNVEYKDGQLELNLERLRMAVDDLLVKLSQMFAKQKLQTVFLINNYDMIISVLKEAGPDGGKIQQHFEELLKNNTAIFVEELLLEHFNDLIKFVKTRGSEDPSTGTERPITIAEVEPIVKDFASRWKAAIELGGYYNVKKIVQEMQYNAKMPVDKDSVVKEVSARKAAIRKDKSNEVKLQLSSATCLEHECEDTSSIGEAEAKLQNPIAAEQMLLHEISRISGSDNKDAAAQVLGAEVKSISHSEEPLPENNIKQKDSPMEDFKFDGRKQMDEQRHSPKPEKRTRKLPNEHKADIQAESKPSLWKNMKSFADGILNMWWKQ